MDESAVIESLTSIKKRFNLLDSNLNAAQRSVLAGEYKSEDCSLICSLLANLDTVLSKYQHLLSCATHIIKTAAIQANPYTEQGNYYDEKRAEQRIRKPDSKHAGQTEKETSEIGPTESAP